MAAVVIQSPRLTITCMGCSKPGASSVCVCVCVCVSVCVCGREGRWFETLVNADKTLNKRDESGIIPLGFLRHADTRVCTT
jgi:hypothetical protein